METTAFHPMFPGYVFNRDGTITKKNGKATTGGIQGSYLVIFIKDKDDHWGKQRVHRLIMEAFSGEPPGDREVDHINANSMDNSYSNLRYLSKGDHRRVTYSANPEHVRKSASKRGKKVIGISPEKDEVAFSTIRNANEFFDLDINSSVISKAIKENGTVYDWSFKYVKNDFAGEEWKQVNDFKGLTTKVFVSNYGRIKKGREPTYGNLSDTGYYKISMLINGKRCDKMVHTMVCWAFHGPMPVGSTSVNHKDRNPKNNCPENLEWSDARSQAQHKLITPPYTEDSSKLANHLLKKTETEEEEEEITSDMEDLDDSTSEMQELNHPPVIFLDPDYIQLKNDFMAVLDESYISPTSNKEIEVSTFDCKYPLSWYEQKVFTDFTIDGILNVDIEIELVSNLDLRHLWKFFRTHTSSCVTSKNPGRVKDFLVKDQVTQKYLGILSLGSDAFACKARDDFIGWDQDNRRSKLVNVVNIRTCVGLQPVSYNFNVGKLLTELCFSKEVLGAFQDAYGDRIAAVTTFGVNGKSIQYDRLKCLKFLGYTKGYGSEHIPKELYDRACTFAKKYNFTSNHRSKMGTIQMLACIFDLPRNQMQMHGIKRGVYLGYTGDNASEFLSESNVILEQNLSSAADITSKWKKRWAIQRFNHLKETNRLKTSIEWTTVPSRSPEPVKKVTEEKVGEKRRNGVFKSAPKEKVKHPRPSIQNVPKGQDQKVAIAITNALTARNKSGMTDAIIDQVRQLLADGVMNKTIETQLNLSRGVITNIKCGAMVKLSEMDTDTFKDKYAMDSEASPKTPTPEHKQPGRRKISNPKLMDMLKYLVNHPMSVLELTDKSQELFEITFTAAVAKNVLRGKTRLDEVEFPVGDTTWTEYLDMLNIIMDRDYTNLAWEYKRSLKA